MENDQDRLSELFDIKLKNGMLTAEQVEEVTELFGKKSIITVFITKFEFAELNKKFDELRALQSKVATDSYVDVMNNWLSKMDEPPITKDTAGDLLDYNNILRLKNKSAEFADWFHKNHLDIEVWNKDEHEMDPGYQRLYIWNQIRPNNPKYYETYILSVSTSLLVYLLLY